MRPFFAGTRIPSLSSLYLFPSILYPFYLYLFPCPLSFPFLFPLSFLLSFPYPLSFLYPRYCFCYAWYPPLMGWVVFWLWVRLCCGCCCWWVW